MYTTIRTVSIKAVKQYRKVLYSNKNLGSDSHISEIDIYNLRIFLYNCVSLIMIYKQKRHDIYLYTCSTFYIYIASQITKIITHINNFLSM